jgi:hypothetical protein
MGKMMKAERVFGGAVALDGRIIEKIEGDPI